MIIIKKTNIGRYTSKTETDDKHQMEQLLMVKIKRNIH